MCSITIHCLLCISDLHLLMQAKHVSCMLWQSDSRYRTPIIYQIILQKKGSRKVYRRLVVISQLKLPNVKNSSFDMHELKLSEATRWISGLSPGRAEGLDGIFQMVRESALMLLKSILVAGVINRSVSSGVSQISEKFLDQLYPYGQI